MQDKFKECKLTFNMKDYVPIPENSEDFIKEKTKKLLDFLKRRVFDTKRGEYMIKSKLITYKPTDDDFRRRIKKTLSYQNLLSKKEK